MDNKQVAQNSFAEDDEVDESTETDQLLHNASSQPSLIERRSVMKERSQTVDNQVPEAAADEPGALRGEIRKSGSDTNLFAQRSAPSTLPAMKKLSKSRNVALPTIELPRHGSREGGNDGEGENPTVVSSTPVPESASPIGRLMRVKARFSESTVDPRGSDSSEATTRVARPQARSTRTGNSTKSVKQSKNSGLVVMKIRIYFSDNSCEEFSVPGGRQFNSKELLHMLAARVSTDVDIFMESCTLWFISPSLELQLKPYHVPWEVYNKWGPILRRFTYLDECTITYDIPKLVCKRNAYLSLMREREITEDYGTIAHIMYLDAKEAYCNARYIVDAMDESITLAAIQLAIHKDEDRFISKDRKGEPKQYESQLEWISNHVSKCCPKYRISRMKSYYLFGVNLISCAGKQNEISEEFDRWIQEKERGNHYLKLEYLEILRKTPFYGAAYFDAQIELRSDRASLLFNPHRRLFTRNGDDAMDVKVAISRQYVTVIDMNRHEVILCQQISDCTWKHMMCVDEESKNKIENPRPDIPCLLLHYPDKEDLQTIVEARYTGDSAAADLTPTSSLLQFFCRESEMMKALLDTQHERNISEALEMYDVEERKLRSKREEKVRKRDLNRSKRMAKKIAEEGNDPAANAEEAQEDDDTGYSSEQDLKEDCERLEQFVREKLEPSRESYDCVFDNYNLGRFCYATFDREGQLMHAEGSLKIGCHYKQVDQSKRIAREAEELAKAALAQQS